MTATAVTAMTVVLLAGSLAGCGSGTVETSAGDGYGSTPSPAGSGTPGSGTPAGTPVPTASMGGRTAAQLLQAASGAFASAPSVHVAGTAVRGSDAYVVDVHLAGDRGGTATIKTSGHTVQVVRIGDAAYVGGDLAFWRSVTGDDARARGLVGSWVRTGADDPEFASYVQFTQPATFAAVLPKPDGSATAAAMTTIRGVPAVGIRDGAGTTLYVATTGSAYPLRIDGLANGQVVFLDFSEYGAPVTLRAPVKVTKGGGGS